jgi:hypothetical protein
MAFGMVDIAGRRARKISPGPGYLTRANFGGCRSGAVGQVANR